MVNLNEKYSWAALHLFHHWIMNHISPPLKFNLDTQKRPGPKRKFHLPTIDFQKLWLCFKEAFNTIHGESYLHCRGQHDIVMPRGGVTELGEVRKVSWKRWHHAHEFQGQRSSVTLFLLLFFCLVNRCNMDLRYLSKLWSILSWKWSKTFTVSRFALLRCLRSWWKKDPWSLYKLYLPYGCEIGCI